jgi:hypothetical protein
MGVDVDPAELCVFVPPVLTLPPVLALPPVSFVPLGLDVLAVALSPPAAVNAPPLLDPACVDMPPEANAPLLACQPAVPPLTLASPALPELEPLHATTKMQISGSGAMRVIFIEDLSLSSADVMDASVALPSI